MTQPFEGHVGRTYADSKGWWPPLESPPAGAPNVVIVLLDDVGYAQFGAYGSDIATPTFDRLASQGRRYANFHTTALCSPTRACLLTGRNHHSNGMARVVELAAGFPGYNATIPKENGFLSEILRDQGYATLAVGKWHLTPATEMAAGQPTRQVAARARLRPLLRVHGGRDRPVPPRIGARQPSRRTAADSRRGLPPHRGPGGPRHPLPGRPAGSVTLDTVPPVVRSRRLPRSAPGAGGVHRALPRRLRQGMGPLASRRCSPGNWRRACCPRAPSSPNAPRGSRPGTR